MTVEVRRGTARFQTREQGRSTWHSFSFGTHYDPGNVGFGPLVCHDEHLLRGGEGFPDHPHRDVEIVTWVVTGALEHAGGPAGADGDRGVVHPGQVQVLWTGDGVTHAEIAEPGAGPTRFVQAWLRPEPAPDVAPERSVADTDPARGGLVLAASAADPGAAVLLRTPGASLWVARLDRGDTVRLPDADRLHAFVARGALTRSSLAEPLAAGDAFRISDRPGPEVTAAAETELLVWAFDG
jgi:redox-sensitive bicupin YhaK (pirin superfamily)